MKKTTIFIALLTSSLLSFSQEKQPILSNKFDLKKAQEKVTKLNEKFSNLPQEERLKYLEYRAEAHRLFSNKRTFEALILVHQMFSIFKEDPAVINLYGAIQVEFRNFQQARSVFQQAIDITGEDPKLLFNMAELAFCDNDWKTCLSEMEYIINQINTIETDIKNQAIAENREPTKESFVNTDFFKIMVFKQLLCHLALSQDKKLSEEQRKSHVETATVFADRFSFLEDSPYHYYAKAALAYHADDETEAIALIRSAKRVFANNPAATTSWDDTMVEFGYIQSHYGKHFSAESDPQGL